MEKYFKSEKELLQGIIDVEGDCVSADWCIMCPFSHLCVLKAINQAKLLSKDERVLKAYNKLFDNLMENELNEEISNDGEAIEVYKRSRE